MPRSVLLGSVALAASYMLPITVLLGSTQEQQNLRGQQNANQKDARVLAAATSIIRGETNELTRAHSSNANRLMSKQATLSQSATIQSLSSSVTTANEKLELGVYDSTGANGGPGALAARTASFTAVTGWNTQSIISPVTLPAGSYWLGYLRDSNSSKFSVADFSGSAKWRSLTFDPMPNPYGLPTGSVSSYWSFYATPIRSTDPSPSPTPAPAPSPTPGGPAYPIAVSANKHYFVDVNNQPYYMVADSVWALATSLTPTQAASYFQLRASQGFNAALIDAVNDGIIFGAPTNTNGNAPFTAKLPGSNAADLSKPNEAYWRDFDNILRIAAQNHILVIANVYETYSATFSSGDGGTPNGDSPNSLANLTAYGNFLGKRYVNFDNIMWMFGNDYQNNDQANNKMIALIKGIRQYDTRHLFTLENGANTTTFWNTTMRPYLNANGIYMYYGQMGSESYRSHFLGQYSRADVAPTFNMESDYDASPNGLPWELRMQHYIYLLSGSSGDWYGHDHVWGFQGDWQSVLTTQGTNEMGYFNILRNSIPWTSLIPDQDGTVFTGIGGNTSSEYSGASTADGKLALAYKPKSGTGAQSFTVNMAAFSGAVTAEWYDPTNGTHIAIGSGLANSGSKSFSALTKNSAGDNDFVLVLTVP